MRDSPKPLPPEISRTSAPGDQRGKAPSVESDVALRRKAGPNDI